MQIQRQKTSKIKTLDRKLSTLKYSDKVENDPWLPFLNLSTNERMLLL